MPAEYQLKKDPLSRSRLHKVAKALIEESKQDRDKALQTYDYFKKIVDDMQGNVDAGIPDNVSTAQKCMIDCLRLAQDSRTKVIKALELLIKADNKFAPKSTEAETEDQEDISFEDLAS